MENGLKEKPTLIEPQNPGVSFLCLSYVHNLSVKTKGKQSPACRSSCAYCFHHPPCCCDQYLTGNNRKGRSLFGLRVCGYSPLRWGRPGGGDSLSLWWQKSAAARSHLHRPGNSGGAETESSCRSQDPLPPSQMHLPRSPQNSVTTWG